MTHSDLTTTLSHWDIDGGLAADFDGSLSGLGAELGSSTYNMSEALLALPVFKHESVENGRFQYVLGAATSPAVKLSEESVTYLNQGQSYEIKVKSVGDLSEYRGKLLKSVIKIQFHQRRLQYMEREHLDKWRQDRPGERILDIDIPLSYGIVNVTFDPIHHNYATFVWDPAIESGIYIRVHCVSTEFTPKKHGGEKGVPFRLEILTYTSEQNSKLLHGAYSQIKVFKPKGADRKHKTDREKMEKRPESEKEKFQPSYDCTVLSEIPLDTLLNPANHTTPVSSISLSEITPYPFPSASTSSTFPTNHSFSSIGSDPGGSPTAASPTSSYSIPTTTCTPDIIDIMSSHIKPSPVSQHTLKPTSSSQEVTDWLNRYRFSNYTRIFQNFSGADLLRLSRDDLIQICGVPDGIRLCNAMLAKAVRPVLTIYLCQESDSVYHAMYMTQTTLSELCTKVAQLYSIPDSHILDIYIQGPASIRILVNDQVIENLADRSMFKVEVLSDSTSNTYKFLLKPAD